MQERYASTLRDLQSDSRVLMMKKFPQHGGTNTYDHCMNVTVTAVRLARAFRLKEYKLANIVVGGMLHDFYLYDYHKHRRTPRGIHAFSHPQAALDNAREIRDLNKRQENVIASHMFPATISRAPRYAESWIVNIADKYCALRELIAGRKGWHAA